MAIKIVHNAKLRNTSICGATETLLIHKKIVKKFCNPILNKLALNNCKIIGDRYFYDFNGDREQITLIESENIDYYNKNFNTYRFNIKILNRLITK